MNIVLLGAYPPPHGGVQSHVYALRKYLREQGDRCRVINVTRAPESGDEDVYYPRSAHALMRYLFRLPADIVHLHLGGTLPPRVMGLVLACAMRPGSKSVLSFHSGGFPSSADGKAASPGSLRAWVFQRCDRVIAVNDELGKMFERFGVRKERIRVIAPHALPKAPPAEPYPEWLGKFVDSHRPILLSVGLLEPEYQLPMQIDTFEEVLKTHPSAGLVLMGSGSLHEELRQRIAAKAYSSSVLLCGDVPHQAALRAIAECDVLLRTTLYDGDSVAVREALHFGTPVIATDNGMRPEGVRLIPVQAPEKLVEAIEAAFREGRNEQGSGKELLENLNQLRAVYEELLR
ncbi:MAG: glycosyltransferase family 4 protein [Bryobacteraceae bacterium]